MEYEIKVEGFCLWATVNVLEDAPPNPNSWDSDWDFYGSRELEFNLVSGICYDEDGVRMDVPDYQLPVLAHQYGPQITLALWVEIDAVKRRQRWAA